MRYRDMNTWERDEYLVEILCKVGVVILPLALFVELLICL